MGRRLLTIKQRNQIRTIVDFASTVFPRKITEGDYFYFRTKRGRSVILGRRLFQIFLTGGRSLYIFVLLYQAIKENRRKK